MGSLAIEMEGCYYLPKHFLSLSSFLEIFKNDALLSFTAKFVFFGDMS